MKRHRTLEEYTAIVANIIYKEGEITEEELIDALEKRGISHWVFDKLKTHIKKRLSLSYSDIKLNHQQTLFWIGLLDNSLSSLSVEDKENTK